MLNAVRRAEGYLRGGFEILKLGSGIWNWNAYISNNNRRFMTSLPLVREDGFSHEELAPAARLVILRSLLSYHAGKTRADQAYS